MVGPVTNHNPRKDVSELSKRRHAAVVCLILLPFGLAYLVQVIHAPAHPFVCNSGIASVVEFCTTGRPIWFLLIVSGFALAFRFFFGTLAIKGTNVARLWTGRGTTR